MGWADSVDRVLQMRREAKLEADRADLIRIIQEAEERLAFVVNRHAHEVLKDVPSWKSPQRGTTAHKARKRQLGGMITFQEVRRRQEFKLSAETRKRQRRAEEFAAVLGEKLPAKEPTQQKSSGGDGCRNLNLSRMWSSSAKAGRSTR